MRRPREVLDVIDVQRVDANEEGAPGQQRLVPGPPQHAYDFHSQFFCSATGQAV